MEKTKCPLCNSNCVHAEQDKYVCLKCKHEFSNNVIIQNKKVNCYYCGALNYCSDKAEKFRCHSCNKVNEIIYPKKQQSVEIRCPKCGSTQIYADKKGFSGRKAVVGGLLTGGIGLLAGTIGSNKIKMTCLSCGNSFEPGEGRHKLSKDEELIKFVIGGILFIAICFLFKNC